MDKWSFFLVLSVLSLVSAIAFYIIKRMIKHKSNLVLCLFIGTALAALSLFVPICIKTLPDQSWIEIALVSILDVMQLFVVNLGFSDVIELLPTLNKWVFMGYSVMFSLVMVLAPVLTFGFVLSFFKNISSYRKYIFHYNSDTFIFSELNEKSLALAQSLYKNNKKRFIVFTDFFEGDDEKTIELMEKAKYIKAIFFKKDFLDINFSFHSKHKKLVFFAIGEDQSENIDDALQLIEKMKYRPHTKIYVFSNHTESEILLSGAFKKDVDDKGRTPKIKIRRINSTRSLITRTLYEDGFEKIFASAAQCEDGTRKIGAVIIGMGRHGTEMTKALSWFGQMDGYSLDIHCFDSDSRAKEKFVSLCPELMDEKLNGTNTDGESNYKITIYSGVDASTKSFDDIISALPQITYVFVALGDDERNTWTAMKLRMLFERSGQRPKIHSIVYNNEKIEALREVRNFKNQSYEIDFIGDRISSYSEEVIISSDIESEALKRHMQWGKEEDFWQFDYNYKSSAASVIHKRMKSLCKIPGIDKNKADRTEQELWNIRKLEHKRWNAYMRSEGYVYGKERNDLAKTHPCLVPFDELPYEEKIKDDD